jgi:hypothetical protein
VKLDLTKPIRRTHGLFPDSQYVYIGQLPDGGLLFGINDGSGPWRIYSDCPLSLRHAEQVFENVPERVERWLNIYVPSCRTIGAIAESLAEANANSMQSSGGRVAILHLTFESDRLVASEVIPVEPAGGKE